MTSGQFALAALLTVCARPVTAAPVPVAYAPKLVGTCAFTVVRRVEQRLEDETHRSVAGSGSQIELADGVLGVSYDEMPAVNRSRVGDRVMTCLAKRPTHCPPGDKRGRWYTTTNLRTDEAWTLPDAEHECGGA